MGLLKTQRMGRVKTHGRTIRPSSIAYLCVGGLVLLGIVCLIVYQHPPPEIPRSQEAMLERALERHNYEVYFDAVRIAKGLLPELPNIKWSHIGLNQQSSSCVLKHGLWYAQGIADVPTGPGVVSREDWQMVFAPEVEKLIYFRIGGMQCGDSNAAWQALNGQ